MDGLQDLFMAVFFFVAGLHLVAGGLPRWATVTGGVCGIIVALFYLFARFF